MRRIIFCLVICLTAAGAGHLYYKQTGDFSIRHISYEGLNHMQPNLPEFPLNDEAGHALNQTYRYFAKGNQSYAFLSEDGEYVVKFFNFRQFKPSHWKNIILSLPFLERQNQKHQAMLEKKLERIFQGHRVAYIHSKESSGLLYIHLKKTASFDKQLTVIDGIRFKSTLKLNNYCFSLQKRAVITKTKLSDALRSGDVEKAKVLLKKIIDLYLAEYQNGVLDKDQNLMINTGFVEETSIRIDVGKLVLSEEIKEKKAQKEDLNNLIEKRIDKWLKANFPEYRDAIYLFVKEYSAAALSS